ncbi:alkaline phosphatase PhoX, partial [Corynebacterium striatum]
CLGECENTSDNEYFGDQISRRTALRAGGLTVVAVGGSAALAACSPSSTDSAAGSSTAAGGGKTSDAKVELTSAQGMLFDAVQPNTKDEVVIPAGYEQSVLIAWGDPVIEGAPKFDVNKQ